MHVALTNLDPNSSARLTIRLEGVKPRGVTGQILTADAMNAINTFEKPDSVRPRAFTGAKVAGEQLVLDLPAKSLVVLALQ